MSCTCAPPIPGYERPNHRDHLSCRKCGRLIDERLLNPDPLIRDFFDHLECGAPKKPNGEAEEVWQAFRRQCELREKAGRPTFGYRFLGRDNCADALEEAADFGIYMFLEQLKLLYTRGDELAISVALQGAHHAYEAYRCACVVREKVHGSP